LLDVAIAGLIVVNVSIFRLMNASQPLTLVSQSVTVFVGGLALLVNVYVWPLMVLFDMPLDQLVRTALQMVFAHPWRSIFTAVIGLAPLLAGLLLPAAFTVMLTISTCALLISRGAWRIIRLYVEEDELVKLESSPLIPKKR
jgi:uncharacterized membrane protein YesL